MKKIIRTTLFCVLAFVVATVQLSAKNHGAVKYNGDFALVASASVSKIGYGPMCAFETCHGVNIRNSAFVGLGLGMNYSIFADDVFVPVFIKGKIMLKNNTLVKPFVEARLGGMFCVGDGTSNMLTMSPAIGVSCSKFFCSFGYEYLGGIEEFRGDIGMGGSGWISNGFATHGLRLTLGVNFR